MQTKKYLSLLYLPVIFLVLICCATFAFRATFADDNAYATNADVIVTQTEEGYLSSFEGTEETYETLQEVFDNLPSDRVNLINVTSDLPITIKTDCIVGGNVTFHLSQNKFAITVSGCNVNFIGFGIVSNYGCIYISWNGKITYTSGNASTDKPTESSSVIKNDGEADINGCKITKTDPDVMYCGISNNGKMAIRDEVTVEADSALYAVKGNLTVYGGTFKTLSDNPSSMEGYSVLVANGTFTANGGQFLSPIYCPNENSDINISCNAKIIVNPSQSQKFITVYGKKLYLGKNCILNITVEDGTAKFDGVKSEEGFRVVGFTVDGEKVTEKEFSLSEVNSVIPLENNEYTLTLVYGGETYHTETVVFGKLIRLSDLPTPDVAGYELTGFSVEDNFNIAEDTLLTANLALSKPTISASDLSYRYDGNEKILSGEVSHPLPDATLEVTWEKCVNYDEWITLDGAEVILSQVKDSGTYRCTATATFGRDVSTASKIIEVKIEKGRYENISYEYQGNFVYTPDKRLSAYPLPNGYSWLDSTQFPSASSSDNPKTYTAVYNGDPENYEDYYLEIFIDIQKATLTYGDIPVRPSFSDTYNGSPLSAFVLEENFHWENPEIIPTVSQSRYRAYYNPDEENYNNYYLWIDLYLQKGDYPDTKILADIEKVYDRTPLGEYDLGEGYAIKFSAEYTRYTVLTAGRHELPCVYHEIVNGVKDPNYNDFTFTLTVTVSKAQSPMPTEILELNAVYNGQSLDAYTYLLPSGYEWKNSETIPTLTVTEYGAYYNTDKNNYFDCETTVKLILAKGTLSDTDIVYPTLNSVVYDKNARLGDIVLPEGWRWISPDTLPTVAVGSYSAVYTSTDENYEPYTTELSLEVTKAQIPTALLPDKTFVYDGEPHYLEISEPAEQLRLVEYKYNGQTEAGTYTVTAYLAQEDTENYILHPTQINGTLTIKKAPSVIVGTTRYYYPVGTQSVTFDATVQNEEQTLIIPDFTATEAGIYTVTLRTAESRNYLSGELSVTVVLNKTLLHIGNMTYEGGFDGKTLYGIISSDNGIPFDGNMSISKLPSEKAYCEIEISTLVADKEYYGEFTVKVLMPKDMRELKNLKVAKEDGEIAFSVENGVYLVFETNGNERFFIYGEAKTPFPWQWILIGIAVPLVAGAVIVILYKKGIIKIRKKSVEPETMESSDENGNKE